MATAIVARRGFPEPHLDSLPNATRPAMPEFTRAPLHGSGPGLFSEDELRRLMRIEFDRAQRYKYPLVCMVVSVDRMERIQDMYGQELKREILNGIQSLLRGTVRESDVIGSVINDRLVVLVTHTPPEGARTLAQRMLEGARRLRFQAGMRQVRITISIGGSHNQQGANLFFDTLIEVAEGGLGVAQGAGGDRYVHSELYAFFQEKHERERRASGYVEEPMPESLTPPLPRPIDGPTPEVLRGIVAEEGSKALESARRAQDALVNAIKNMQATGNGDISVELENYKRQIDVLERRITKLTQLLSMTEGELRRLIDAKSIDPGVASIYKDVQGLTEAEANAEAKKDIMKRIFQANLELKEKLSSGS